ncbi:MAG TPA: hypothetical protein PLU64_10060 [Saprospiraceae bacterium]|nr:hypothetical protein [Saprospiraceae bacterium]
MDEWMVGWMNEWLDGLAFSLLKGVFTLPGFPFGPEIESGQRKKQPQRLKKLFELS